MYRFIVFDMDGTLADTLPGILNCHQYVHSEMNRPIPPTGMLRKVIGAPLLHTYRTEFGFSEKDAAQAVALYRKRYAEKGIHEASLYPGMKETLQALRIADFRLGVATLKADRFVRVMLQELEILNCFVSIHGMDESDQRTKAQLIRLCMNETDASPDETVMVGDSVHDLRGARESGVSFLGVTYGYGLTSESIPDDILLCHTPQELLEIMKGMN